MKEVCDLDREAENYGWCFDCVPEENSLLLKFGETIMELPSINLVFQEPRNLLGEGVHARFGDEFPIRFDLLDTMGGGNLSFQVHPLTEYIQQSFGMHYTQDESYYMLDAGDHCTVYLGTVEGIEPEEMAADLEAAQRGEKAFDDKRFVNRQPAKKCGDSSENKADLLKILVYREQEAAVKEPESAAICRNRVGYF